MRLLRPVKLSATMLLLLWVLSWSLFSFWILSSMSSQADENRREALAAMCEDRALVLEDQVKASMNHLRALAALVSTFHHSAAIDQATFARYAARTAALQRRPLTRGVAYAARVAHAEREPFERRQSWSIRAMNSSAVRSPADEYAPVVFAEDAVRHVISFDMLLGHEDRDNILRARESGKGVLSAPSKLLNNRLGVALTYPVYKSELPPNATAQERIRSAMGYMGGVFDMEEHVDESHHQLAGKGSVVVDVYDTTKETPARMFGSDDDDKGSSGGWCHVTKLNFGDPSRKHEMHCSTTRELAIGPPS